MEAMKHHSPWDVRQPQPAVQSLIETGAFTGRVLDAGCGYGENALLIAASGLSVTGIDRDPEALERATRLARERSLEDRARFLRFDVLDLANPADVTDLADLADATELGAPFDTVLDSLVFHSFAGRVREQYVAGLRSVLRPGGRLYVLCYSNLHVGPPFPPHQVSLADLDEAFADGWSVDEVRQTWSISNLAPDGVTAWIVTCTRDHEES